MGESQVRETEGWLAEEGGICKEMREGLEACGRGVWEETY